MDMNSKEPLEDGAKEELKGNSEDVLIAPRRTIMTLERGDPREELKDKTWKKALNKAKVRRSKSIADNRQARMKKSLLASDLADYDKVLGYNPLLTRDELLSKVE